MTSRARRMSRIMHSQLRKSRIQKRPAKLSWTPTSFGGQRSFVSQKYPYSPPDPLWALTTGSLKFRRRPCTLQSYMRHEPGPKSILRIVRGNTHCDHFKIAISPFIEMWGLSTFLLDLIGLCLLQQMEYSRSNVRSEKAIQSPPSSLEYSLLDSWATM